MRRQIVELTQRELDLARRKTNKPAERITEKRTLIGERRYSSEDYFRAKNKDCVNNGNYQIVEGRREPLMDAEFNYHFSPFQKTFLEDSE